MSPTPQTVLPATVTSPEDEFEAEKRETVSPEEQASDDSSSRWRDLQTRSVTVRKTHINQSHFKSHLSNSFHLAAAGALFLRIMRTRMIVLVAAAGAPFASKSLKVIGAKAFPAFV